jgi:hypothetical protein
MKEKIIGVIIFVLIGQLTALLAWLMLGISTFHYGAVGSVVAFLIGYKEKPPSEHVKANA